MMRTESERLFAEASALLPGDRLSLAFSCAGICSRPLTAHREAFPVTQPAVRADVHEPLDVHLCFTAQSTLNLQVAGNNGADLGHFVVIQLTDLLRVFDACLIENPMRRAAADAENIGQPNFCTFILW
jgi:hypothetical protein